MSSLSSKSTASTARAVTSLSDEPLTRNIARRSRSAGQWERVSDISALMQRIFEGRGVVSPEQVDAALGHLLPPHNMRGIEDAAALLVSAIKQQKRILVVGDFDADGATSTTLAILSLRMLGAHYVDYEVPNRFEYGYGLTPEIVELAAQKSPDLLVTVDNGISSIAGVAEAKRRGWEVIVTDHHLAGDALPAADAIVNPNQPDCTFPSKALAGVGVMFYVALATRSMMRQQGMFAGDPPNLAELLDLVALGTVADVVPLDRNNRILVEQGLRRIRAGRCRPGIQALLDVAGRDAKRLVASDLGFILGPRLNAAGRLDDMATGIECLLTDSHHLALEHAQVLDALNRDRKAIEAEMRVQAESMLENVQLSEREPPWGVCLYDDRWHQGVIGIVASRIKEQLHRPVIAFAPGDTGELKGSARSIEGLHIRDCLDVLAKQAPDLLQKFGGHAMAAGLSLRESDYSRFASLFDQIVRQCMEPEALQPVLFTDGVLAPDELTLASAEQIRRGGPWGQGFPEPLFDGEFKVASVRWLKEKHLKLTLLDERCEQLIDAIYFNADSRLQATQWDRVRIAYRLDINEYRGKQQLQFIISYLEPI